MKAVRLPAPLLASIRAHARASYPEECCGFLLSPAADDSRSGERRITEVVPAPNGSSAERRRRFVISADALRRAEADAETRDRVVSGFYHSHPDHPAAPSQFDQDHGWPWYAYLIVGSGRTDAPDALGAFELDPDRRVFERIPLAVDPAPTGRPRPEAG